MYSTVIVVFLCVVEIFRNQTWVLQKQTLNSSVSDFVVQSISIEQWAEKLNREAEEYAKNTLDLNIQIPAREHTAKFQSRGKNNKKHPHATIRKRTGRTKTTKSFYSRDWRINPRIPKADITYYGDNRQVDNNAWESYFTHDKISGENWGADVPSTMNANSTISFTSNLLRTSLQQIIGESHNVKSTEESVERDPRVQLQPAAVNYFVGSSNNVVAEQNENLNRKDHVNGNSFNLTHMEQGQSSINRQEQEATESHLVAENNTHHKGQNDNVGRLASSKNGTKLSRKFFQAEQPSQATRRRQPSRRESAVGREMEVYQQLGNRIFGSAPNPFENREYKAWTPFEPGEDLTHEHKIPIKYTWADKRLVAHHVYINQRHKLMITTIPKVACTEFMRLMIRMTGARNWRMDPHFRPKNPTLSRLVPPEASAILNDRSWTKAVFFRDPAERLLSAYLDKVSLDF